MEYFPLSLAIIAAEWKAKPRNIAEALAI